MEFIKFYFSEMTIVDYVFWFFTFLLLGYCLRYLIFPVYED